MGAFVDLSGRRFTRLTVLRRVENRGRDTMWLCRCDCGSEFRVSASHLKSGHTKSCGCYRTDVIIQQGHENATHGMKCTKLYRIWSGIKDRCLNPDSVKYADYGGRGIAVCEEWRHSFVAFQNWAISAGYRDGLSIDREDNDGPYSPVNCRWVGRVVQANNKRSNRLLSFDGRTQTLTQWAADVGILPSTLRERLCRGWSVEKALFTPVLKKRDR